MPEDQKKDKKTRIHRSIITGLSASAVAAVVAVASAFFSCQAAEWNVENIAFIDVHPTGKCDSLLAGATLGMCWSVTITNARKSRLTVVAATWENMDSSPGDLLFGMVHILTPDGKPVPIPFSLDSGERTRLRRWTGRRRRQQHSGVRFQSADAATMEGERSRTEPA